MIFSPLFHFCILNSDISVTIYVIEMKLSVYLPKVLFEGSLSQFFLYRAFRVIG